jgi:hypothetical protein
MANKMISTYLESRLKTIRTRGLTFFIKKSFNTILFNNMFKAQLIHGFFVKNRIDCKANKKLLADERKKHKLHQNARVEPLISVIIPTYNRALILTERTIPSVLRQSYQNFELLIIGDHCTDNTEELIKKKFFDKRIRFINLPKRGKYPKSPCLRWFVAGGIPRNVGLKIAKGEWIAPLDDDDEYSDDHLRILLDYALETENELVYGTALMEKNPGKWERIGSFPIENGSVCHLSVLYSSSLRFLKYDNESWKYLEPNDANLWRRMQEAGVKIGFIDKIVGIHHEEGSIRKTVERAEHLHIFSAPIPEIETSQKFREERLK